MDTPSQPIGAAILSPLVEATHAETGITAGELIGKKLLEVLPDTEPAWIDTYRRLATTGRPSLFERYTGRG